MVLMLVTRCDAAWGAVCSQRTWYRRHVWMVSLQMVYIKFAKAFFSAGVYDDR